MTRAAFDLNVRRGTRAAIAYALLDVMATQASDVGVRLSAGPLRDWRTAPLTKCQRTGKVWTSICTRSAGHLSDAPGSRLDS